MIRLALLIFSLIGLTTGHSAAQGDQQQVPGWVQMLSDRTDGVLFRYSDYTEQEGGWVLMARRTPGVPMQFSIIKSYMRVDCSDLSVDQLSSSMVPYALAGTAGNPLGWQPIEDERQALEDRENMRPEPESILYMMIAAQCFDRADISDVSIPSNVLLIDYLSGIFYRNRPQDPNYFLSCYLENRDPALYQSDEFDCSSSGDW
ncbi:hypothetical protein [Hyphobacterium indicum]|uniref:hypothetical protein n=1 Tax=Hyphobacterium indicum TaxID=2162714 RepID=UPI000D65E067|nr:hypothetical protein [Hyphobacterium indicum]